MSTTPKPSEHAMRYALKHYREVATVFDEPVPDDDVYATAFAHDIDQHAIAPAVAELRASIDNPHAVHAHYLQIGNGWEVWTTERVRGMERDLEQKDRRIAELEEGLIKASELLTGVRKYMPTHGSFGEEGIDRFESGQSMILALLAKPERSAP